MLLPELAELLAQTSLCFWYDLYSTSHQNVGYCTRILRAKNLDRLRQQPLL
jgi:hypothetical protein